MKSRTLLAGAVLGAALIGGTAGSAAAAVRVDPGQLIQPGRAGQATTVTHGGTYYANNWAGYFVEPSGGGVTGVKGAFTVEAPGLLPPGISSDWAGIGGAPGSSTLIQAGVTANSLEGTLTAGLASPVYQAWYELIPDVMTPIDSGCTGDTTCAVKAGDKITVDISNVSGNDWSISVADVGKWTWQKDVTYASDEKSAEWIDEAPGLTALGLPTVLPGMSPTPFTADNTYTAGGTTQTIAAGNPTKVVSVPLVSNNLGLTMGYPSALASDGESFSVCTYTTSCATP